MEGMEGGRPSEGDFGRGGEGCKREVEVEEDQHLGRARAEEEGQEGRQGEREEEAKEVEAVMGTE